MGWRESLRKGSFRGIPFFVDSSSAGFGRRNVLHEYPLRDIPYAEDLGRAQKEFAVEAYVVGEDYLQKRDALISACERPGRGELIHPYYGSLFVVISGKIRVSESASEGGVARFSIPFVEAGERIFPSARNDIFSRVSNARDNLLSKAQAAFEAVYQVLDSPQFVLNTAKTTVNALIDTFTGIKGSVEGAFAEFYHSAKEIAENIDGLIPDGKKLSPVILNTISQISTISEDPKEVIGAYTVLMNFGGKDFGGKDIPNQLASNQLDPPVIPARVAALGGTDTRIREKQNLDAIVGLIKQAAIAWVAPIAAEASYPSLQDAIVARDAILAVIDRQMEAEFVDDDTYQALHDVRKTLSEALPPPTADLPSLVPYQNIQTRPSLVLAYDLYEKLDREEDIIERNQVEHPGFVPGGVTLEVIRDS